MNEKIVKEQAILVQSKNPMDFIVNSLQDKFYRLVNVEILNQVVKDSMTYTLVAIECIDNLYMVNGRRRLLHYYIKVPDGMSFKDLDEKISYETLKYIPDNILCEFNDLFENKIDGNSVFYYFDTTIDNKKVVEKFLNVYIETETEKVWMYKMT